MLCTGEPCWEKNRLHPIFISFHLAPDKKVTLTAAPNPLIYFLQLSHRQFSFRTILDTSKGLRNTFAPLTTMITQLRHVMIRIRAAACYRYASYSWIRGCGAQLAHLTKRAPDNFTPNAAIKHCRLPVELVKRIKSALLL